MFEDTVTQLLYIYFNRNCKVCEGFSFNKKIVLTHVQGPPMPNVGYK